MVSCQSDQSPLTPDTDKAFQSMQLLLNGQLVFLGPWSVSPGDGCDVVKIPGDQSRLSGTNDHVHHIHRY